MNNEAESALVSSMMLRPEVSDEVSDLVTADDFVSPSIRNIFVAILDLYRGGVEIDVVTVAEKVGDIATVGALIRNAPTGSPVSYASIVADRSRLRKFSAAWHQASGVILDEGLSLPERVDRVGDILNDAIKTDSVESKTLTGKPLFQEWYNELERLSVIGDEITGIKTGFPDLDKHCKGWHGGEMIVIAARPGMGKTNLAINTAWSAVKQGKQVLYFSLEMSRLELMHRIAAQAETIDYEKVQTAQLGDDAVGHKVTNFVSNNLTKGLHINDRAGHTMASIRTESKKTLRKYGLDMIIIDHIGLLNSKDENQYSKMTNISRQVKLLAKELNVPVIALTQLNRAVENRPDPRPKMSDLRDSGAIEQDADAVMFPYRDNDPDATEDKRSLGQLIIAKLRHGKVGVIPLLVQFQYCRFLSADKASLPSNWMEVGQKRKQRHDL